MFFVKELVKWSLLCKRHKVVPQLGSNGIYWHRLHNQTVSDENKDDLTSINI